ncbi:MAG: type II CRISPR RNA-guided endonuclease Cas9 [Thermoleophilia bacterium]
MTTESPKSYRIGIDVGLNSVGLAAIEVDGSGTPVEILSLQTIIHDGGVDPTANKTAGTRKAVSGVARRMRRLVRRRRQRLLKLDETLRSLQWPIVDLETFADPYYPWRVRRDLLTIRIDDQQDLHEKLSVAVRHIARHRGWRSPYASVESLKAATGPSKEFHTLIDLLNKRDAGMFDDTMAAAEIVCAALESDSRLRIRGTRKRKDGRNVTPLLEGKTHQSDNVREMRRIWERQDLPEDQFETVVEAVFAQRSSKGSAAGRVGKDPLPGMGDEPRAEKASLAFQRFRIADKVANLRIRDTLAKNVRPLTPDERRAAIAFLWTSDDVSWDDVAVFLGVSRRDLLGTAKETELGERGAGRPPVNVTDLRIRESKIKELVQYWDSVDDVGKEALLVVISNGSGSGDQDDRAREAEARATEFVEQLPEEVLAKLDNIKLPEGRAAYSAKSMRRITRWMEESEDDLHAARKHCFPTIDDSWKPPADPIGQPVGNPAVDRVTKIIARYLASAEHIWGPPLSVNIEHTRDGLMSEAMARKEARERNKNADENAKARQEIPLEFLAASRDAGEDDLHEVDGPARFGARQSDVYRWRAIQRQNSRCLYCGTTLQWGTFEMDHIVPRAGQGSTNTQTNLAAVCRECNHAKGKLPFAVWAGSDSAKDRGVTLEDAIARAEDFFDTAAKNDSKRRKPYTREGRIIKGVRDRLRRSDADDDLDNRSIESVGWMANELHRRIEVHYRDELKSLTRVAVYRGWITSEARKAAGIQRRLLLIGDQGDSKVGKNRLDRRHHAVDAATIAMIRPGVAQALVVRDNLRHAAQIVGPRGEIDWKHYRGTNPALFAEWQTQMERLVDMVQLAVESDHVPVFEFLRLRLGSSAGHEDTIRPLKKLRVGDAWSTEQIDRSATPAQWVALTRQPDFTPGMGLPADPERRLRVQGTWHGADDELSYFPTGAGCISVRGGYAELGASFHHARIYRCQQALKSGKVKSFYAMMRVYEVDLLRHAHEDLFTVDIPPQAISRRVAEQRLRGVLEQGAAEYIGWIVLGDELLLDMTSQHGRGQVGDVLAAYSGTTRWVCDGLFTESKLRLRPRALSGEGVSDDAPDGVQKAIAGGGWLPSVDVVFGACKAQVVRRDILGRPRLKSERGLPTCWRVM